MRIRIDGAGAAGLTLAVELVRARIPDLRIDLHDRHFEPRSDRTWCFWSADSEVLPGMVRHSWNRLRIDGPRGPHAGSLPPDLRYRMADSGTYMRLALAELRASGRVDLIPGDVEGTASVRHDHHFSSTLPPVLPASPLLQHFLGWEIRTEAPVFDPAEALLMDFDRDARNGFGFTYVLPTAPDRALVEYTLFTPTLLPREAYETELQAYCARFGGYTIERTEYGVIPMATGIWNPRQGAIHRIGAAAGLAKASTGYTFSRIVRDSRAIAASLAGTGTVRRPAPSGLRKSGMDAFILGFIRHRPAYAVTLFENLFRRIGFDGMLRFLDERTGLKEDLGVMWGTFRGR